MGVTGARITRAPLAFACAARARPPHNHVALIASERALPAGSGARPQLGACGRPPAKGSGAFLLASGDVSQLNPGVRAQF